MVLRVVMALLCSAQFMRGAVPSSDASRSDASLFLREQKEPSLQGSRLFSKWMPSSWCQMCMPNAVNQMKSVWKQHNSKQQQSADSVWLGHWLLESSEDDKAEDALRAEGVPYLARKVAMRFKPERRFFMEDSDMVGELKTLTGGWSEISVSRETTFRSAGYVTRARTSWEGDVLITVTTVAGPFGKSTTTTTTRHYIDDGHRLVSETISPGGRYKTYFAKVNNDGTVGSAPDEAAWQPQFT